jgi:hypothetical protein
VLRAGEEFDAFTSNPGNQIMKEPRGIDSIFRQRANRSEVSTNQWADGYLSAFSIAAGIRLVTFQNST